MIVGCKLHTSPNWNLEHIVDMKFVFHTVNNVCFNSLKAYGKFNTFYGTTGLSKFGRLVKFISNQLDAI